MIVGHHPPHPFPDALLGLQFRRIGRLAFEAQPSCRILEGGRDRCAFMLFCAIVDHSEPLAAIGPQQVPQEMGACACAHGGAAMMVGLACQRCDGPIDMDFGMVIPRRHLWDVIAQAPLGGQGGVPADGRVIDKQSLTVLRPVLSQRRECGHKGLVLRGLASQMAVASSPPAKAQRMQSWPGALPAIGEAKAGRDIVTNQLGRP